MTLTDSKNNPVANVYPLGMGCSDVVLQDNEGNSALTELEELSSASEQVCNPENAAINIENSSDVIIGPVTQFNGPVTIYQSVNGTQSKNNKLKDESHTVKVDKEAKLVKSESTSSDVPHPTDSSKKFGCRRYIYLKYIGVTCTLVVIVTITIITVLLTKGIQKEKLSVGNDFANGTGPLGSHHLITRDEWGGQAPKFTVILPHPTPYVVISHTVTGMCWSIHECSERVRSIQSYHVGSVHSPDIGYNFLIGGDGNVYVGRGWDIRNFHKGKFNSIGISFIGNFLYDELPFTMIEACQKLLEAGVDLEKLHKDYSLVGHNQTMATQSPGPNVYKVIKEWPHFREGRVLSETIER